MHDWMRRINRWMRACYPGTRWFKLVRRLPVRGASYWNWWEAAVDALQMWQLMVEEPMPGPDWPLTLGDGGTVEQFEERITAFQQAHEALRPGKMKLKEARSTLRQAQREAAALLMAYGHGVRARLGQTGRLVRTIPKVWPGRKASAAARAKGRANGGRQTRGRGGAPARIAPTA